MDRDEREDLEATGWELIDGTFDFMAKSVQFELDDTQGSIRQTVRELHEFRSIVEPNIEVIVAVR